MSRYSGKYGVLNGHKSIRNWNVATTNDARTARLSNTAAGTVRAPGVKDWTGSFNTVEPTPAIMPGDTFTFAGYVGPSTGVPGATGARYDGPAICSSFVTTLDWEANSIETVANIAGQGGPLVLTTGVALTDVTTPSLFVTEGLWVKYSTTLTDTNATVFAQNTAKFINATRAVLTITCMNPAYVDSDTANTRGRSRGPVDWTLAITQNDIDPATQLAEGTALVVVVPINGTDFWGLRFGKVVNYTGVTVDNESGNIVQQTVNIGMQAHSGATMGAIRKPGASTDWWPHAA